MKLPTPEKLVKRIQKLKGKYSRLCFIKRLDLLDPETLNINNIKISIGGSNPEEELHDKVSLTLMELSMAYNIACFTSYDDRRNKTKGLIIPVEKSEDGTTNITADVIQAFMDIAKRIEK